jgi:hypothetical protein
MLIPTIKIVFFFYRRRRDVIIKYLGLFSTQNEQSANKRNFREPLRFGTDAGYEDLKEHIQTCSKNKLEDTDEILNIYNDFVLQTLVFRVSSAKYFQYLQMKLPLFPPLTNFRFVYGMWVELK